MLPTIVTVLVILAILGLGFILRPILRVAVPDDVTIPVGGTGALVATLVRKGWGFGGFTPVPGTVRLRTPVPSVVSAAATELTTTAAAPDAQFNLTALQVGTGNQQVWGTSSFGNHGQGWFTSGPWVKIIVTGG